MTAFLWYAGKVRPVLIKRRKSSRIFFGWWTVLTGGVLSLLGHGYYTYGFSALFKPISAELGFSRTATSIPASIGRLEGGFEAPITGWVTDRFGPKWIVLLGVFLIGSGLVLMYFVNSLWAYYVVWGVILGTGINIGLSLPIDKSIANWFVKKRGLALGIRMVFSGLSGVMVMPIVAWLITVSGWRTACLIGGLVMWAVGLPLAWFFLKKDRPEHYGLLPDGAESKEALTDGEHMIDRGVKYAAEVGEIEFTLRQALKTPAFWLLIITNSMHSMAGPAINIHGIPFLTDIGVDPLRAASMLAMSIFSGIPARLIFGIIVDRLSKNRFRFLLGGAYLLQTAGFYIFLLNQNMVTIYVWFILYGIGQGAGIALMAPMRARYFGRKAFGSIAGISRMAMAPVGMFVPIYLGWVYDTSGSYISAFNLIAILLAISAFMAFTIIPPKPPAEITDVRQIV